MSIFLFVKYMTKTGIIHMRISLFFCVLFYRFFNFLHLKREPVISDKGSPYDNAVAEATFKSIKTEFVHGRVQQELDLELFDYVNWFNNIRIHRSLYRNGYVLLAAL